MERYGKIPPRFTKAWWEYFWEYYKWYVLGVIFAVLLSCMFLYQCTHRVKYDMNIVYAGHDTYTETQKEQICSLAKEYVPDTDGNGEINIYFQSLVFSDKAGQEEYDYAVQTKLDLTFVDDCYYIYLMDEIEAALYMQRDTIEDIFEPVSEYADLSGAETLTGSDGSPYAIRLTESAALKEMGIEGDKLYLMVRGNINPDKEKDIKSHSGAIAFAKAIVG